MAESTNNDWRKLTAVLYKKPTDSKIFGTVEFDITAVEAYIQSKRQSGLKVTLTHIFLLAFSRGLKEAAPEINCYVRRGQIIQRNSVDVSVSVLANNGQMSSVKVIGAENLSIPELASYLQNEIQKTRLGKGQHVEKAKNMVVKIPWPLRQWVVNWIKWLSIDMGLNLPFIGVSPDTFGSFVLSNLGSIGLDIGYPALAPFSNVGMVVTLGSVTTKPMVVQGQILPRRVITISAALDHRVVDGMQIGRLFNYLRGMIKNPVVLDDRPAWATAQ